MALGSKESDSAVSEMWICPQNSKIFRLISLLNPVMKAVVAIITAAAPREYLIALRALGDTNGTTSDPVAGLLAEGAALHLEADLRWLDITEMRLEDVKGQPLPEPEIRQRGQPKKEK